MIDRLSFDTPTGSLYNRRILIRDNQRKDKPQMVRLYNFTEMGEMLRYAGDEPLLSGKVVQGFGQILERERPGDPTLNAYLINFTAELDEPEWIWSIIQAAFEEQRVDLDIITPEDLETFEEEE